MNDLEGTVRAQSDTLDRRNWRGSRFPPALDAERVPLDSRTEAELIDYAYRYSTLLTYVDEENQPRGDWSAFLADDVSFLLARICVTDARGEYAAGQHKSLQEQLDLARRHLQRLRDWQDHAQALAERRPGAAVERLLRDAIDTVIEQETADLGLGKLEQQITTLENQRTTDEEWIPLRTRTALEFSAVNRATRRLVEVAPGYLDISLREKSDHPPQTGLLLAFVSLLRDAKSHLNRIPARHLDYYYRTVLGLEPQPAVADRAAVCLSLAEPFRESVVVPEGTLIDAGKDHRGLAIHYRLDKELVVRPARVRELRAIFAQRLPGDGGDWIQGIRFHRETSTNAWDVPGATLKDSVAAGAPTRLGFAIASPVLLLREGRRYVELDLEFGAAEPRSLRQAMAAYADRVREFAGGPVADAVLKRYLSDALSLSYSGPQGQPVAVTRYWIGPAPEPDRLCIAFLLEPSDPPMLPRDVEGDSPGDPTVVVELNADAMVPIYSALLGLQLEGVAIRVAVRGLRRHLVLHGPQGPIPPGEPFQPFGGIPAEGAYFVFSSDELWRKRLTDLSVRVIWNNLTGPAKDLKNYYAGYGLDIRNDSFRVRFSRRMNYRWMPLGASAGDRPATEERVRLFAESPENQSEIAPESRWRLDVRDTFFDILRPLGSEASFDQSVETGFFSMVLDEPEFGFAHSRYPTVLTDAAMERAQRDNLGKKIVKRSKDLISALTPGGIGKKDEDKKDAKNGGAQGQDAANKPLPNAPFVPEAAAITLDYSATGYVAIEPSAQVRTDAGDGRIYRLDPFDPSRLQAPSSAILSDFTDDGYVFIGLDGLQPSQTLSLFVGLLDHEGDGRDSDSPPATDRLRWRYLSVDGWAELVPRQQIADATNGFTRSGIVIIRLPSDIAVHRGSDSGAEVWLSVSLICPLRRITETTVPGSRREVEPGTAGVPPASLVGTARPGRQDAGGPSCAGKRDTGNRLRLIENLRELRCNGGTATRVMVRREQELPAQIPPGTLSKLVGRWPQIGEVRQPEPSWGGRRQESEREFRVRVSERLRHKQRAVLPEDYESLVLQEFPWVRQAECLRADPGEVRVVVVPCAEAASDSAHPRVPEYRLDEIVRFLEVKVSPGVRRIHVRSPRYERVRVFAWVSLNPVFDASAISRLYRSVDAHIAPWRSDPNERIEIGSGRVDLDRLSEVLIAEPAVARVHRLSVLHAYQRAHAGASDSGWRLFDTSRVDPSSSRARRVRSSTPWSVLVPSSRHRFSIWQGGVVGQASIGGELEVLDGEAPERFGVAPVRSIGIGDLSIGEDFIVGL
ncbi:baseplate J/gp47 family protein [Thiocapsa marina]|uniref:Baseplate protein J-like domain-containing protein n=1 Tax=Thiocapsa marina 5811 TaxID=768671 RepID=F9U9K6_9GAMM|nr:hypothetical protein [Thiocapsa marina]EGV18804.1 hypothetical protein ThimaDRAFT_1608 [Thiocapsa marina 5811]